MIFVSRGTQTIDITPTGWGLSHTGTSSFFARAAALMTTLGSEDMAPDLREFVGMFSGVQVGANAVQATVLVRSDLTDEDIEARRRRLAQHLSNTAHAVAEFFEDGTVRILESSGLVEIGTRAPCPAGHGPTEECDRCRGTRLGGLEYPLHATRLPESA